jgi:DNA-binding beta-propeller fold protein YncE
MKRFIFLVMAATIVIGMIMPSCKKQNKPPINPTNTMVTTLAGPGIGGSSAGAGLASSFNNPVGVAVDYAGNVYVADSGNNVYVADAGNNMIRKIDPSGAVSALAGSGQPGAANGIGALATFNHPTGVAVDASGNVYVADAGNNLIRKITQ